jgi:hypothetical protein
MIAEGASSHIFVIFELFLGTLVKIPLGFGLRRLQYVTKHLGNCTRFVSSKPTTPFLQHIIPSTALQRS